MAEGPEKKPTEKKETPKDKGKEAPEREKATQAEMIKRIAAVEDLMLRGASRNNILRSITMKWGVLERQAENYIAEVRKAWRMAEAERAPHRMEDALEKRRFLYEKAVAGEDYRLALEVEKSTTKLRGLDVDRVEIVGMAGEEEKAALSKLSDEELEALEKLQEKTNGDKAPDTDSDGD